MALPPPGQVVQQRYWRVALPAGVMALILAAVAYVVLRNPYANSLTPPCVLLHATGLFCPGCGGTRAVYDLATGNITGALSMNAFVTLMVIPPAAVGLVWWMLHALGIKTPRVHIPLPVVWGYLGLLVAFAVLRNVPYFEPLLSPV